MTKADIVTQVYDKLGCSKRESLDVIEHFFDIVKGCLLNGETVKISGLGNFTVRKKRARKGTNPETGDEIEIAPRTVLAFKHSQVLKEEMNRSAEEPPPVLS